MSNAVRDVLAERERQKSVEGWSDDHDNQHDSGEMAKAAAAYAIQGTLTRGKLPIVSGRGLWPWSEEWWKPKDRRRNLVRAGALIIAEIDRLDRLAVDNSSPSSP